MTADTKLSTTPILEDLFLARLYISDIKDVNILADQVIEIIKRTNATTIYMILKMSVDNPELVMKIHRYCIAAVGKPSAFLNSSEEAQERLTLVADRLYEKWLAKRTTA